MKKGSLVLKGSSIPFILQLMIISIFLFGTEVRYGFNKGLINHNNVIILLGFLVLVLFRRSINTKYILCYLTLSLIEIGVDICNSSTNQTLTRILITVPLLLLSVDYKKTTINYERVVIKSLKTYNFFIIILLLIYIIDGFTDGLIMRWYASTVAPNIEEWIPSQMTFFGYRYSSILGQSLVTCEAFVIFLILNLSYGHKTGKYLYNKYLIYIISLLGILATASKTGIVLSTCILFYAFITEKKPGVKILILAAIIGILYIVGAFSVISIRLFDSKTLTTGRVENYVMAYNAGVIKVKLLGGTGSDLIRAYSSAIGAFRAQIINEFPFASLVLQCGIIYALIYVWVIYLSPVMNLWKQHDKFYFVCATALFVEINTYNLIITYMDAVFMYVFVLLVLIFIVEIPDGKKA